jgi:stage V sporulation protein B
MSAKRKFIYNGIILTLVGFAMRGVALFLGAYISSEIGAEGIGLQGLIATVYSFAVTFATSGVSLSVTRLVASSIGEGRGGERVIRGAFLYALCFGAVATAILFIFSDLIGAAILSDERIAVALRILSLSLLPIALSSVISGYFVAVRRVALNATVQVLGQVMRIGLTVFLLGRIDGVDIGASVRALALGATVTEVICFVIALIEYLVDRWLHKGIKESGADVREVSKMALPLAFSAYVRSFLLSVEHSLIPRRLVDKGNSRSEALASYGYLGGMALPIILFPMTPLSSFSGLLVPEFAESEASSDKSRISRMASGAIEKALVYAIIVAVFIFAFSEELGYVIYHTYAAGRYIGFLAPVIPLMYLDHVTDSMLKGIGEHVYSMWVNIADSFLSVFLVWALIPIFDISGYAIVIIAMEMFNFALSYLRLRKRIRFGFNPLRAIVMPLLASLIAIIISKSAFVFTGNSASLFWLVMQILFGACICIAILLVTVIGKGYKEIKA